MKVDKYRNFDELLRGEREALDYKIVREERNSPIVILAPHGGLIEPHTSLISVAICADLYNLYCFEGLRNRPHRDLHITSTNFDEPSCLSMIATCDHVVAVHGLAGAPEAVDVGGRDAILREAISHALVAAGFVAKSVTTGDHAAISQANICNRGRSGSGAQLEITRALRDQLALQPEALEAFAAAVRAPIDARLKATNAV